MIEQLLLALLALSRKRAVRLYLRSFSLPSARRADLIKPQLLGSGQNFESLFHLLKTAPHTLCPILDPAPAAAPFHLVKTLILQCGANKLFVTTKSENLPSRAAAVQL